MKRRALSLAVLAALVAAGAFAERQPSFAVGAFNAAIPATDRPAVFSPFGFEVDSAVFSEACDTVTKAKFVETIGALTGYDTVLLPVIARYADARTNHFEFVSARTFLTPSLERVKCEYRERMLEGYSVATCLRAPDRTGADSWLAAKTDGLLGASVLPAADLAGRRVTFRECIYFHPRWSRRLEPAAKGFVTGALAVDRWQTRRFALLRLPMADGAWFFALLPNAGTPLDALRAEFTEERIDQLLAVATSIVDTGVDHAVRQVTVPTMDLTSDVDLSPAFRRFQFPLAAFTDIDAHEGIDPPVQKIRFVLDGAGAETETTATPRGPSVAGEAIALDRPFLFFVWHEPTRTMPAAGIYTGGAQ